jgi:hypothetical protein
MTEILIFAAAGFNIAFAIFHLMFWRLFGWKQDLPRLRAVNQAIVPVLNLALTFMFLLVGMIMLLEPPIPTLLAGMAVFWLLRALVQPIYFGLQQVASKLITVIFLLGTIGHGLAWYGLS